jgi:hypothetical protein
MRSHFDERVNVAREVQDDLIRLRDKMAQMRKRKRRIGAATPEFLAFDKHMRDWFMRAHLLLGDAVLLCNLAASMDTGPGREAAIEHALGELENAIQLVADRLQKYSDALHKLSSAPRPVDKDLPPNVVRF